MPTMNVSLPQGLAEFVEQEVQSGGYSTASEVVRDGLRLLRYEKEAREEKLAILRREIQIARDEVDAGQFSEESVMDILAEVRAEGARKK
ncbi:MAG TPA: type II toxin-antitoxin system ParD family antitoxin [Dongiaceae bacterium]|nr:type II toxin-antitoxin system ParD family antitoxin [Dongiaceae bacterium]